MVESFSSFREDCTRQRGSQPRNRGCKLSDERVGDVDGDSFDDALIIRAGSSYALYRGAATLPTKVAMTWTDATTASGAGGVDVDGTGLPTS